MIIYRIYNTKNNKSYIGQSENSFKDRYNDSGNWQQATKNKYLQEDLKIYNKQDFQIQILKEDVCSKKELNKLENQFIQIYNSFYPNGYNESPINKGNNISKSLRKGKLYKFKDPNGNIIEIENLSQFCRERDLSVELMIHVNNKKYKKHKGWTRPETVLIERKIKAPDGTIFTIKEGELRDFCRKNDLFRAGLANVWSGKYKQHKGWTRI